MRRFFNELSNRIYGIGAILFYGLTIIDGIFYNGQDIYDLCLIAIGLNILYYVEGKEE